MNLDLMMVFFGFVIMLLCLMRSLVRRWVLGVFGFIRLMSCFVNLFVLVFWSGGVDRVLVCMLLSDWLIVLLLKILILFMVLFWIMVIVCSLVLRWLMLRIFLRGCGSDLIGLGKLMVMLLCFDLIVRCF